MNRRKLRSWFLKLTIVVGTVVLLVVLLEIAFRLMGYGNLEIYEPDHALYWRLKPHQNCFTKVDHKPVRINSHGTRGAEFPVDKPSGAIRILSLGDSRTFGWGLSEAETYSGVLEQLLQEKAGSARQIHVINAGVNAWSYPQMLVYLRERGLAFKPDFILVGDANLWTQFSESSDPAFVEKFMWRVRFKNLLRRSALYHYIIEVRLKNFYERHRTKFIPVDPKQDTLFKEQQKSDPDAVLRDAIENICRLALTNHARPVLLFQPTLTDLESGATSNVVRVKMEINRLLNLPLVDMTAALAPAAKKYYLEADPVHLNAAGNKLIGRQLADLFGPLVAP